MSSSAKTFPEWLKAERERTGLTQTQLARRVGVKPQYIHNLEKGATSAEGKPAKPSTAFCLRLALALGVHYLEVLRVVGHAPEDIPESEVNARMAADYVASLPEDKQEEAVGYLKFLFEKFGDESKMRRLAPKNPAVVGEGEQAPPPVSKTTPRVASKRETTPREDVNEAGSARPAKNGGRKNG